MQISVAVRAYYERDLEGVYPKLTRHLRYTAPALVAGNPSLYDMAGQIDQLLYNFEGTKLSKVLARHKGSLKEIHKRIQENLADWNLAQADKLLYELEDVFDEIEGDLE